MLHHDELDRLGLDGEPVAIAFLAEPPAGVAPWDGGEVAAGCAFWRHARAGQTFYTEPAAHRHCAVGVHVHGLSLPDDQAGDLGASIELMVGAGYLDPAEVPAIPTVADAPRYVAYGPAGRVPFDADVVVVAATPAQAMLLHEAAMRAGVSPTTVPVAGRPACAILPLAMQSSQSALSLGCAGNRVTTGLGDGELYSAVPGASWPAVVDALAAIRSANEAMAAYYEHRAERVSAADSH
ncbi:hypothetical protein BH24ACT2_BH24ACT2_12090 [soil metagenome]